MSYKIQLKTIYLTKMAYNNNAKYAVFETK